MSDVRVDEMVVAVVDEITRRIDAALAEAGDAGRRSSKLVAASRGLDAEAEALRDPARVKERVQHLRFQIKQLTNPVTLAEQRLVMSRAAEGLRKAAERGA